MDSKGDVALTDWDGRPAISLSVSDAFAILKPGDYWTRVDGQTLERQASCVLLISGQECSKALVNQLQK